MQSQAIVKRDSKSITHFHWQPSRPRTFIDSFPMDATILAMGVST